jgi:L-alanine-DL-glutamate epimerase-like enolase superfamily enzyme
MMARQLTTHGVAIARVKVCAYKVPTDSPESDGTYEWSATTLVLVEVTAGGATGIGYTYADKSVATLIHEVLAGVVEGRDAMSVPGAWSAMVAAIRNLGRPGIAAMAISAIDSALWDLKARLLELPLVTLLGAHTDQAAVYGSGGYTSYSSRQLRDQFVRWMDRGITRFKMKIGRDPGRDLERVQDARDCIGIDRELFVDANGAYSRKQALLSVQAVADQGVAWFEEPVSSDDLDGLRLVRDRSPAGMDITAGEYGFDLFYFRRMLDAGAVDVLQADATRCGGITGYLRVGALCESHCLPLSAHCAPALHLHPSCSLPSFRHLEYFHDHERIENLLFDGAAIPTEGTLRPDLSRPGMGLEFKHLDATRYAI